MDNKSINFANNLSPLAFKVRNASPEYGEPIPKKSKASTAELAEDISNQILDADGEVEIEPSVEPELEIADEPALLDISDEVLRAQVCQDCFQYLSVGPITIDARGKSICGRCNVNKVQTKSFYNILAQGLKFKCTNHMNGCNEQLSLAEMRNHEVNCNYESEKSLLCSFSGSLAQNLNHALKFHPKNITIDGKIQFSLSETEYKKTFPQHNLLYLLNDNLYVLGFGITKKLVKVLIQAEHQSFKAKHFAIKFFKVTDPLDCVSALTDYLWLHENSPYYSFEKATKYLEMIFGMDSTLCCQVSMVETKDIEIQKCLDVLRTGGNNSAQAQHKNESYHRATKIIKLISAAFFKCGTCKQKFATDMYYCENLHFYCENCLETICKHCHTTREYKNLKDLDFEVACEYADCDVNVKIMRYLAHKIQCPKRPYKCPLENCNETVFSTPRLIQHWHAVIPRLFVRRRLELDKYKTEEFFWLAKKDLYRVLVHFTEQDIKVLIDGIDVLNKDASFRMFLAGPSIRSNNLYNNTSRVLDLSMTSFCGKHEACEKNNKNYKKLIIQYVSDMI
ncbi:unnamed protein product [Ceutorhynchus assimilis]|uniref:SIAH-type domain-containing protein n=1 Tax=Ceutorhynchus assimilis TaxID=467358 RepID=A0A9N9MWD5_9CUCU|nr:unnamed protein product [Ceutorhynchus assimilis]